MHAPSRQQTDLNECGACGSQWRACKCKIDNRTESLESLLSNVELFPDADHRHACMFVYLSYQRWSTKQGAGSDDFSLACVPPWEGWYAGWLKPDIYFPEEVPWTDNTVLRCVFYFVNGSRLNAYIESNGRLILCIPGVRPPGGRDYDEDRELVRMSVGVSQDLTVDEIRTGHRGIVYGGRSPPNSWRRASHVVQVTDDICEVKMLADNDKATGVSTNIDTKRVQHYAPYMIEEAIWRTRRRFKRALGREVQRFAYALFQRAELNDEAVRFALRRGWADGLPSPARLLSTVERDAEALADDTPGRDNGDEG